MEPENCTVADLASSVPEHFGNGWKSLEPEEKVCMRLDRLDWKQSRFVQGVLK